MVSTPGEGQQKLFDPETPPVIPTAQESAILRGIAIARDFARDPDSYGANWPSIGMNQRAKEEMALGPEVDYTDVDTVEVPEAAPSGKAVLGSAARRDASFPDAPLALRPAFGNPSGRSAAGLRVEQEALSQDYKDAEARAAAARHPSGAQKSRAGKRK